MLVWTKDMRMLRKSIAQLERDDWGEPPADAPPSIARCYRLRRVPIESLTLADVRLLLGQDIGLPYLAPIAIEALKKQPLIETEHYCGDLLANILRISPTFYDEHKKYKDDVISMIRYYRRHLTSLDPIDAKYATKAVEEAIRSGGW
jgi:hypothetical protein